MVGLNAHRLVTDLFNQLNCLESSFFPIFATIPPALYFPFETTHFLGEYRVQIHSLKYLLLICYILGITLRTEDTVVNKT